MEEGIIEGIRLELKHKWQSGNRSIGISKVACRIGNRESKNCRKRTREKKIKRR